MKAYVIKNNEGKYFKQCFDNGYIDFTDNILSCELYAKKIGAEDTVDFILRNKYKFNIENLEIVKITIAEGDLEEELNKYKSLYIENEKVVDYQYIKLIEKEIEKLKDKPIIETDRETGTMKIDNIEFNVEQTKAISHLLEAFEKKVTEDVCNKIKNFTEEDWDYDDFTYFLNKIEKGEE